MEKYDLIIVGAGPAGIFAALEVARGSSLPRVLMLEKGPLIQKRQCPTTQLGRCIGCSPCQVVSGWGGAGALSDGKLTLTAAVGGHLDKYIEQAALEELILYVDESYLKFGAPQELWGTDQESFSELERKALAADLRLIPYPVRHLGTGRTATILESMYQYLQEKVEIRPQTRARNILTTGRKVSGVELEDGQVLACDHLIVAPGREGAGWLAEQAKALQLATAMNPVDVGVRVELPAAVFEPITQVAYEAKLLYYAPSFDDQVRTFCMCPHGQVVTENNGGLVTVNGHTHATERTENTNFALLVSKNFTEPFRDPIAYGKNVAALANLLGEGVIVQRLGDLRSGRRSTAERIERGLVRPTLKAATPGDLSLVFPYRHLLSILEMLEALDRLAPGVNSRHTLLYGVEVKFYSSRFELTDKLESRQLANLYLIGDGAGITRGLVQASISGVVAARSILEKI
ncbi:MAG: NAD(P)/FAD-dependent oxidoreductase [Firmicutes bacterium]|nr:NAD(P)/FAD-dependent oxidoreductase [Bacillota bacterium]HOB21735.1 NAD(P)/FAD-dependent oxidoreductase [Bacillota bacterium]HQD39659.1 NAD(P)/FAD-dependent oxidoreductase [Bacillota bacterium]